MSTTFSFEVFPPKKTMGIETIYNTLGDLRDLKPDFISVTYGAGGSVSSGNTINIANYIKDVCGVKAVAHMPCLYMTREKVYNTLCLLKENGIDNILALRGDAIPDCVPAGEFQYASDLISYIKYVEGTIGDGSGFSIYGACYPEKHPESKNVIDDICHLKQKVDSGVTHLLSQLFFDNSTFYRFVESARLGGINVPIEAGIMPVINKKQIERMTSICGANLPEKFRKIMNKYEDSPEALRDAGIAYAVDQIVDLVANGVEGVHLYTMNNSYVAQRINDAVRNLF